MFLNWRIKYWEREYNRLAKKRDRILEIRDGDEYIPEAWDAANLLRNQMAEARRKEQRLKAKKLIREV